MNATWTLAEVGEAEGLDDPPPPPHPAGPTKSAAKIRIGASSDKAAHETRNLFTTGPLGKISRTDLGIRNRSRGQLKKGRGGTAAVFAHAIRGPSDSIVVDRV